MTAEPASPVVTFPELSPASPLFPHDPYTVEQRDAIASFLRASVSVELPPTLAAAHESDPEIFAVKFLTARKWKVEDALKMLTETAKFRHEKQLDTTAWFPSTVPVRGYDVEKLIEFQGLGRRKEGELDAIHAHLRSVYTAAWHKWDKLGHPVYIERTGSVRVKELVAKCKALTPPGGDIAEPSRKSHLHSNEVGGVLLRYQNQAAQRAGGGKVVQVTVVMDCTNMTMGHLFGPAMDILKQNSVMDQAYYPEGLYRLYVVNAPRMITMAWSIVRGWIEPRVQKKVQFVKPADTVRVLLENIDAEHLPKFLGGTCECDGDCVPELLPCDADDAGSLPLTEELAVGRRSVLNREFDVLKGTTVSWEYAVVGSAKYDISFKAMLNDKVLCDIPRKNCGEGSVAVQEDCKLQFLFDNSYSWLHGKTVSFRIMFEEAS